MIFYKQYTIENDMWLIQRKYIYHLMGINGNELHPVASYSLKTKQLILKRANELIPPYHIISEFIEFCENKERNDKLEA